MTMKPQQWLNEVLSGRIAMEDAPASIQSWARLPIFQGACEIIALDTQDERRAELARIPQLIRPYVEREVRRVWVMRQEL